MWMIGSKSIDDVRYHEMDLPHLCRRGPTNAIISERDHGVQVGCRTGRLHDAQVPGAIVIAALLDRSHVWMFTCIYRGQRVLSCVRPTATDNAPRKKGDLWGPW